MSNTTNTTHIDTWNGHTHMYRGMGVNSKLKKRRQIILEKENID